MNDYVVPKEVIERVKEEAEDFSYPSDQWLNGYRQAMQNFLDMINVPFKREVE